MLLVRRPPRSTRTYTLISYTTRFRSRFFVTTLKTHPKQNLIRDFIERSDDAAVAYVIIQNTTEHRIEMLLAFSGRRLMDQDEAWLLERYQQSITVAAAMLFGDDEFRFLPISYRSEEHTSELQSLMRNSYAVFF